VEDSSEVRHLLLVGNSKRRTDGAPFGAPFFFNSMGLARGLLLAHLPSPLIRYMFGGTLARMMLYLVQHGEALAEAVGPGKPLSPAGTRDMLALAHGFRVSAREVLHSGKPRAAQSADILGQALGIKVRASAGLDPLDPVLPFAGMCEEWEESRIIVGHMPFLGRLASLLLAGRDEPQVLAFQRGGMACLEKTGPSEWCLLWTCFPRQPNPAPNPRGG
jgi:phosphohistidine phosphatase